MVKAHGNPKGLEVTHLRVVMAERGLTNAALARHPALAGISAKRIANVLCGQDYTWPIRAAINRALNTSIFSKPQSRKSRTS